MTLASTRYAYCYSIPHVPLVAPQECTISDSCAKLLLAYTHALITRSDDVARVDPGWSSNGLADWPVHICLRLAGEYLSEGFGIGGSLKSNVDSAVARAHQLRQLLTSEQPPSAAVTSRDYIQIVPWTNVLSLGNDQGDCAMMGNLA
jgi:hypothetical protein